MHNGKMTTILNAPGFEYSQKEKTFVSTQKNTQSNHTLNKQQQ
jgi:hypothetical protein